MASVAVVVPFKGGCRSRERAWDWVQGRYAEAHPSWKIIEATVPSGPWCKALAVNAGIEASDTEIIVQADADCWTDRLGEAVAAVEEGAPWAIPHENVHRLSQDGSAALLLGADWREQTLDRPTYIGLPGGGIIVGAKETLTAIPMDRRFVGWGQEDESWAIALTCLLGAPWRGMADLVHLWHPPQERMTPRRGSPQSWALRCRYFTSRNDPAAMAALVEEGRDASSTDDALHCCSTQSRIR